MVKYRLKSVLLSAVCLILGLLIYIFMRSETHFHFIIPEEIRSFLLSISNAVPDNFFTDFIRFWFVDFLWGASLTFALISVSAEATKKKFILASCISFAAGVLFEFAQLFSLVSGTFDVLDIVMYAAASLLCAAVSIFYLRCRV